jgi:ATP adenylyltransferase
MDSMYHPAGYNIGFNMGLAAGASIEHLHLHVIPRYPREVGIADLVAGKRVLVESPMESARRIRETLRQNPFHL